MPPEKTEQASSLSLSSKHVIYVHIKHKLRDNKNEDSSTPSEQQKQALSLCMERKQTEKAIFPVTKTIQKKKDAPSRSLQHHFQ